MERREPSPAFQACPRRSRLGDRTVQGISSVERGTSSTVPGVPNGLTWCGGRS
ncbi:MAG TPA: hypothetical protein VFC58_00840 [Desulfosporosinus sp.]|nr:hypothetical protein [Desulfosporosinus sp.]